MGDVMVPAIDDLCLISPEHHLKYTAQDSVVRVNRS